MSKKILYTNHAVKQMFNRDISTSDIELILENGETIIEYHDDKPFPSKLLFYQINSRPLHLVYSFDDKTNTVMIITAYEPTKDIWEDDFKTRK